MRDIDKYTKKALEEEAVNCWAYHVIKYQREEKSYGVTKITYDLMPGRHLHWLSIPTFGLFTPTCLLVNGMQYAIGVPSHTHYFDTASGELLGSSQAEAARNANNKGVGFFNQSKFSEAKEWFNKAYQTCATDDSKEASYKNNRDSAISKQKLTEEALDANKKGLEFFNQSNFLEAKEWFEKAYQASPVDAHRKTYKNNIDSAVSKQKLTEEALDANKKGLEFFNQSNFLEAKKWFNKAYQASPVDAHRKTYKNNIDSAVSKQKLTEEALDANKKGLEFFNQSNFLEAKEWFNKAYQTCATDDSKEASYKNNRDSTGLVLGAQNLFNQ